MTDEDGSTQRVVITGADGPIADSIRRHLAADDWTVTSLRRGDEPPGRDTKADGIVVLDAVSGDPAAYQTALRAVAFWLRPGDVRPPVLALTPYPMQHKSRDAVLKRFRAAEEEARDAGLTLTVMRHSLLVGTPEEPGPSDRRLFADRLPLLPVPGNGEQAVRPLLIGDLADSVAAVLGAEDVPPLVLLEGPDKKSLRDHLRALNGDKLRVWGISRRASLVLGVLGYFALILGAVGLMDGFSSGIPIGWLALFLVGLASMVSMGWMLAARLALPDGPMLLDDASETVETTSTPNKIESVWTSAARKKERDQRKADESYRREETSQVTAVLLAFIGLGGIVVGIHDAVVLPTLGGRLAGSLLVLAGVVSVAGAASLFVLGWRGRHVAAFVGALVAGLALASLVIAAVVGGDWPFWGLLVTVTLLVYAGLACIGLGRRGFPVVAGYMADRGFKQLGSLVVGGGLVVVAGQFLFESLYVPSNATPKVTVDVSLVKGKPVGDAMPLTGTITVKNPTDQDVNVLGSLYQVRTLKMIRLTPPPEDQEVSDEVQHRWRRALRAKGRVRSYAREDLDGVVDRGRVVAEGTFLKPDEEVTRRFVSFTPRGDSLARFNVQLYVSRRRFQKVDPPHRGVKQVGSTRVAYSSSAIDDESWIHLLTRSQRYVHVVSSFDTGHLPGCPGKFLASYIDHSKKTELEDACEKGGRHRSEYYGITFADANAELQLDR